MSACKECKHCWGWNIDRAICFQSFTDEWNCIEGRFTYELCSNVNTGPGDCGMFEQRPVPKPAPPQESEPTLWQHFIDASWWWK